MNVRTPHFKMPFQIVGRSAVVVEQDSADEVAQCVVALVRTPVGVRIDDPEYGIIDPTFLNTDDPDEFSEAVEEYEPRAVTLIEVDGLDSMKRRIQIEIQAREEDAL